MPASPSVLGGGRRVERSRGERSVCLVVVGIQAGAAVFSVSEVLSDEGPSQQRLGKEA